MMRLIFIITACLLCTLFSQQALADYLVVTGNTYLRYEPRSEAKTSHLLEKGAGLLLLNDGKQQNAYYKVKVPDSDLTGYIHRARVRRMRGKLPVVNKHIEAVTLTVIDVGPGLSCFIELPNKKYMVYDAGYFAGAYYYIRNKVPLGSDIEYLILSHTDADHWGSVEKLLREYKVRNILYTDFRANELSNTVYNAQKAFGKIDYEHELLNLEELTQKGLSPGDLVYNKDSVKLYFLSGFDELPKDWNKLSDSKQNNGASIVLRLEYMEYSVLLTGDAVGRKDDTDGCIATEQYLMDTLNKTAQLELLDVDVLIAAHHGADNANCKDFIEAVSPEYVIFPAGHKHRHPRGTTAQRFIDAGVPVSHIFRTDLHDYEAGGYKPYQKEWTVGQGSGDIRGDDNVVVHMPINGAIKVIYSSR